MKKILLTAFLFAAITAPAQNGTEILDRIKQANEKVTTITSDFKQTMHLPFMDEDAQSHGRFFYRKPDRLLLKYVEPEGEMILIYGNQVAMGMMGQYTQVSVDDPAVATLYTLLSSCLEGDARKIKGANVSATEQPGHYEVDIQLDNAEARHTKAVKVHYDKKEMTLSLLRTEDIDDGYIIYELTGRKTNPPIADEVFDSLRK